MARVARSNVAMLLPEGCERLDDASYELNMAIQHANAILSWFENLPSDEQPPTWMWPFSDEISEHFDAVKRDRESRYGGGDNYSDLDENEMAVSLKK